MMFLYFVPHEQPAESCPAKDPKMGNMLLQHISPANAQRFGVTIHGDAVLDGRHTFTLNRRGASA